MEYGTLFIEEFDHLDTTVYNTQKMKADYRMALRGNTWQEAGSRSNMPELDGEVMQTAFKDCGQRMATCAGNIFRAFETGTPDLAMQIFQYYAFKRGTNHDNHNDFKFPFRALDQTCRDVVTRCREDLKTILQVAMKKTGNLVAHDPDFLGYVSWEAGPLVSKPSVGGRDNGENAEGQEEKVVCWQLTLSEQFSHIDSRYVYDGNGRGRYERATASIQLAVGIYFKMTFGLYDALVNGRMTSSTFPCTGQALTLSEVTTIYEDAGTDGSQSSPQLPVTADTRSSGFDIDADSASVIFTRPPSYRSNATEATERPPSYNGESSLGRWLRWRG